MNRILSSLIFIFVLLASLSSCRDEIIYDDAVPEGMSRIAATVSFKDFTPALESRSAGDAIKSINTLWVVVYNINGEFIKKEQIEKFTVNDVRPNQRPDGGAQAEENTGHAEFSFNLPNGRYHIYAVANFDLSPYSDDDLETEDQLQKLKLEWDRDDVKNNAEMFGYFAENDSKAADGFDAPVVTVKGAAKLHAWVSRAASKLTIVYDGSGLKENVVVYIKSATIKDIPMQCLLGATNSPGDSNAAPGEADSSDGIDPTEVLYSEGETVVYYDGDTAPEGDDLSITGYEYAVSTGGAPVGSHDETSDKSLFFYENVQPIGEEGTVTDKRQVVKDATETNVPSFPDGNNPANGYDAGWKDGRKYGTYVEIKAFYRSNADGHRSSGEITYRFMLGKNVTTSYSAERNHHYKLTMKFKGYANDVDFHIDYDIPSPSVHVQPYYISYLYNHSMMYPVTIHAGRNEVERVEAEIVENHWYPEVNTGETQIFYDKNADLMAADDYQWHGFLSLRKTKQTVISLPSGAGNNDMVSGAKVSSDNGKYGGVNYKYYYDHLRHRREYSIMTDGDHFEDNRNSDSKTDTVPKTYDTSDDSYNVKKRVDPESGENIYTLMVPMYTRAKQLIKANAYTGNNPFVAYQRKAVVEFKVWLKGVDEPIVERAPITQVRRVVNPKGIYRSSGNTKPFHVTMRILPRENATEFEDLVSEGPWKAYVIAGNRNIIKLSKGGVGADTVRGKTGSILDFNVNFTGSDGHAVIRVDYHNYTCNHLIFVRVGYNPVELYSGDVKWHSCNLRTKNEEAENPADEGSLFKYGNLDCPIDASSNVNVITPWVLPATPKVITDKYDPSVAELNIATDGMTVNKKGAGPKKWDDFKGVADGKPFLGDDRTLGNNLSKEARVASLTDYYNLYLHDDIEQGYGVLYTDDATECATHISAVYGYRYDNRTYGGEDCGMQGMFVYNKNIDDVTYGGRNIFFPIGNSGYGYRRPKHKYQGKDYQADTSPLYAKGGWLLYAGRNDFYEIGDDANGILHRPLFYDKWRRPGALYWLAEPVSKQLKEDAKANKYLGWDINYFTFDYYGISHGDMVSDDGTTVDSGAAFVRLVEGTSTPLKEE